MVETPLNWTMGAVLEEHSRRKHKVVREYLARYLFVRCQHPAQARFGLAIVDGFAGAGIYSWESGSPLIFIEELRAAAEAFNTRRKNEGMAELEIECLLVVNDFDVDTIELLKQNVAPRLADIRQNVPKLHLRVEYRNAEFELVYPEVNALLKAAVFLMSCSIWTSTDTARLRLRPFATS